MKDFTPNMENISLHGLGFMQIKLSEKRRLHIWHPELPKRDYADISAIHNHRFSFTSTVIKGQHFNRRWDCEIDLNGKYNIISHNGPRSEKGGRLSFPVARANFYPRALESYKEGDTYFMPSLEYHDTPNKDIVITVMTKLDEGEIHACSAQEYGTEFDQLFDRFQIPQNKLWDIAKEALTI